MPSILVVNLCTIFMKSKCVMFNCTYVYSVHIRYKMTYKFCIYISTGGVNHHISYMLPDAPLFSHYFIFTSCIDVSVSLRKINFMLCYVMLCYVMLIYNNNI